MVGWFDIADLDVRRAPHSVIGACCSQLYSLLEFMAQSSPGVLFFVDDCQIYILSCSNGRFDEIVHETIQPTRSSQDLLSDKIQCPRMNQIR